MLYSFDNYVLDTELYELRWRGDRRPIEAQVFDLLVYLIRNRGRVVSRGDLIDEIWDGRAMSEAVVDSRISAARRAIGDNGTNQRFIETIRGKGFRFIGDVREHQRPDDVESRAISAPVLRRPTRPELLIGREDDLTLLKARFGIPASNEREPITVVRGWPGVGKTSLVRALAHDSDVASAFPDGLLWAALGETPDVVGELMAWARALGARATGSQHRLEDIVFEVGSLLHDRQLMLIVDHVWEVSATAPFKVGGPRCATLITTRDADVAEDIATTPSDVYLLGKLDETRGLKLLARIAPSFAEEHPAESRQLVIDLDGLPLALRVAGRLLNAEARMGWGGVQKLLAELSATSKLLAELAPEDRYDPHTGTIPTVSLLFKRSTDRLDSQTRDRFAYLSAFRHKPATFDLEAMQAVWQSPDLEDAKRTARKLAGRGLLEPIRGTGRFEMHALLVLHARSMLTE